MRVVGVLILNREDYSVGYTRLHLHRRVEKHKRSAVGKHLERKHNLEANSAIRAKLFT